MHSYNKYFLFLGFSILFGVFVTNILTEVDLIISILLLLVIFFLNFYVYIKQYGIYLFIILIGIILGISAAHLEHSDIAEKQKFLEPFYNNSVSSQFLITDVHKINEFTSQYKAQLLSIQNTLSYNNSNIISHDNNFLDDNTIYFLVTIPSNFTVNKGDILESNDRIYEITNFDPGFNYEKYMHSKSIFFTQKAQSINRLDSQYRNIYLRKIDEVRSMFLSTIHSLYPTEEAIFLGGVLLGARESLSKELSDDFNNSGLTHFIAVSGFNITILIIFLTYILKVFPVFVRAFFIAAAIITFTILVGDTAPVVRASIMGLIIYFISISGREGDNLAIIIFTSLIMVLLSPLILNYDVSFHLSFLAVIGIIYTQDFFKRIFYFLPETLAIKEAFILTLSALSFSLPVMIFNFGQVSLLSPLANVAVTWTIPLIMLLGFLSVIFTFISLTVGIAFAYITWVFLAWDIKIVHFFGGLDWALLKFDFGLYKYSLEILYFILMIFLINHFNKKD